MKTARRQWWFWLVAVVSETILGPGCPSYDGKGDKPFPAPLLSGTNDARDRIDMRGAIHFGDVVRDTFSTTKLLTGFVLDANQGARVTITVAAEGNDDPVLLLYGPQDLRGLWRQNIAMDDDGKDGRNSAIADFPIPAGGRYLIALVTYYGTTGGWFDLSIGCRGACAEPACPEVLCDLYCPAGLMTDPTGCLLCRCTPGECSGDEDCRKSYPWAGASVRCIESVCVGNVPSCDAKTHCPQGYLCDLDLAGCDTSCTDPNCPPCAGICVPVKKLECQSDRDCMVDGAARRCVAGGCVDEALGCSDATGCPDGTTCLVSCGGSPDGGMPPLCQGVCAPTDETATCDGGKQCPEGYECAKECWSCDTTTSSCNCKPGEPGCGEVCRGVCITPRPPECTTVDDCLVADRGLAQCLAGSCVYRQIPCDLNRPCPGDLQCEKIACRPCDPENPQSPECCDFMCVSPPKPECLADTDCVSSDHQLGRCIRERCVFEQLTCKEEIDCPPETRCQWQACASGCDPATQPGCCYGKCVTGGTQECFSDRDCVSPATGGTDIGRCLNGKCVFQQCYCPAVWDPVCAWTPDGIRETLANACFAECRSAMIEYGGECEQHPTDCHNGLKCDPGFFCDASGSCLPIPEMVCTDNRECPADFVCMVGTCAGTSCDPNSGLCPPCKGSGQCVPHGTACMQSGCSGEICAPFPVGGSCVWLPEYGCIALTSCEPLSTLEGQTICGFVQNPEYLQCLAEVSGSSACQNDSTCPPGSNCQTFCEQGVCRSICRKQDCVCPAVIEPVCGTDGLTYESYCLMICSGASSAHPGPCK